MVNEVQAVENFSKIWSQRSWQGIVREGGYTGAKSSAYYDHFL